MQGIFDLYEARKKKKLNTSEKKQSLSQEAREVLLKSFKEEYELYRFARQRLASQMLSQGIKLKSFLNER